MSRYPVDPITGRAVLGGAANRTERRQLARDILNQVGAANLATAYTTDALLFFAPEHWITHDRAQLPASLLEWCERVGAGVCGGHRFVVWYVTDDFACWLAGRECFCGSGDTLGSCHAKGAS